MKLNNLDELGNHALNGKDRNVEQAEDGQLGHAPLCVNSQSM